jgi:hypothetical protein
MIDGGGEEELRAPRPAANRDDVGSETRVGSVDGVVRPERSLVHADVAPVDPEPAGADTVVAEEHVGGQILARA